MEKPQPSNSLSGRRGHGRRLGHRRWKGGFWRPWSGLYQGFLIRTMGLMGCQKLFSKGFIGLQGLSYYVCLLKLLLYVLGLCIKPPGVWNFMVFHELGFCCSPFHKSTRRHFRSALRKHGTALSPARHHTTVQNPRSFRLKKTFYCTKPAVVQIQKQEPVQSSLANPEKPVARNSHVSRLKRSRFQGVDEGSLVVV